jgi:hypothetical protein
MATAQPYVWPYYNPQQQQHLYIQFPNNPPTAADSGSIPGSPRSWHGSPFITPPVLPGLLPVIPAAPPVAEPVTPVYQPALLHPNYSHSSHSRRHSFDAAFVPVQITAAPAVPVVSAVAAPYYTYPTGWVPAPRELQHQRPQLHNLINGEIITHRLHVNFADPDLEFRKRPRSGDHHLVTLSAYDLEQPATNPPMTRVKIVYDAILQWPVDLHVIGTSLSPHRRRRAALPYLTLEDVVHAMHASLHRKISHGEWGVLSASWKTEVARAYTRRYKASGSDWAVRRQQSEGVKRVDFLLKNMWFKGFAWLEPENGVERLKLLLGQEY